MNTQAVRSLIIFIIIAGVLLFAANSISPDPDLEPLNDTSSAQFLDLVLRLDTIAIDFDFITNLGTSAVVTDVRIDDVRPGEVGRSNPFRRTESGVSFGDDLSGIVSNLRPFDGGSSFDPGFDVGAIIPGADDAGFDVGAIIPDAVGGLLEQDSPRNSLPTAVTEDLVLPDASEGATLAR